VTQLGMFNIDSVIFSGGEKVQKHYYDILLKRAPYVAAADQGYDYAAEDGIKVDCAAGDFDSAAGLQKITGQNGIEVFRYGAAKDYSDTELTLQLLYEKGFRRTALIGGGGKRFDHFLSNMQLFCRSYAPLLWITNREAIWDARRQAVITDDFGKTVSFYALNKVRVKVCRGLRWSIKKVDWRQGVMSLSNETAEPPVRLKVSRQSRLLVIKPFEL
jgi:thiamine pyrophosphokinase